MECSPEIVDLFAILVLIIIIILTHSFLKQSRKPLASWQVKSSGIRQSKIC